MVPRLRLRAAPESRSCGEQDLGGGRPEQHLYRLLDSGPDDDEFDFRPGPCETNQLSELADRLDRDAIEEHDHVIQFESDRGGR